MDIVQQEHMAENNNLQVTVHIQNVLQSRLPIKLPVDGMLETKMSIYQAKMLSLRRCGLLFTKWYFRSPMS